MSESSGQSHSHVPREITLNSFVENFLGHSPRWYKVTIVVFLVVNPILWMLPYGHTIASWALVLEFIFTLAMALKCYPLQPGGLLAIEAIVIGMTSPAHVYDEVVGGFKVILLLMFMVAGIYFMKELLHFTFTKLLTHVRSKVALSLLFLFVSAFLSAFLDALTVTAVAISVGVGFYNVYQSVSTEGEDEHGEAYTRHHQDLEDFRAFLRNLLMHAAIGTALGGVTTTVGEPQNLLIADRLGWEFIEFFVNMSIVTMPVLVVGILTCLFLELTGWFAYGKELPPNVRKILEDHDRKETQSLTGREKSRLICQAIAALFLVFALAFHLAEVGIIGLAVIVIQTSLNGVVEEHRLGKAFEEALPFTALLVVFFAIVAIIHEQHLFTPVFNWVLSLEPNVQPGMFYIANGLLSAISDNVFVATIYISEVESAYQAGTISRELFDALGIAVNTGTNIPSVLTPNGQAAFLFLLTSSLAPLIRLSYGRMVMMAFPYFVTMGITGWVMVNFYLF